MNPYRRLLSDFGWSVSPTHENYHWVWLLFNFAADQFDAHPDTVVLSDPHTEILRRLGGYDGPALTSIAQLFAGRIR